MSNGAIPATIVIVGAGHAGVQTAASLRQEGFAGRVVLVDGEGVAPYQRPPLSKAYLKGGMSLENLAFRRPAFYAEHAIEQVTATAAGIDREQRKLMMEDGSALAYDHLVLASGARNRPLLVPGADGRDVVGIRTLRDADFLRGRLATARRVAVVGAGFIGLEFAAVAASAGCQVDVVELAALPMARALSPVMSAFFLGYHVQAGVGFHAGRGVASIGRDAAGAVHGVVLTDSTVVPADLVVFGIGVVPNVELAQDAGIECDNGVVVDADLQTCDAAISAIGDVASFPGGLRGSRLRLESVQNATDQARHLAARLAKGRTAPYRAVPWFWSEQGALRLQIAGLSTGHDDTLVVGSTDSAKFSVLAFRGERLVCVESVNNAADHMAARRLLAGDAVPSRAEAAAPDFSLKTYKGGMPVAAGSGAS